MKKLKIISALALASMTLFSCLNDDNFSTNVSIEGTWTIHELKMNNIVQSFTDCEEYQTVQFTGANTISTFYTGENCTTVEDVETLAYTMTGNILKLVDTDGSIQTINIDELSSHTLKLIVAEGIVVMETTFKR